MASFPPLCRVTRPVIRRRGRHEQRPLPISNLIPLVGLGPQGIDATRQETTRSRRWSPSDEEWGRSESLDPDNVGDIADEGAGHRG